MKTTRNTPTAFRFDPAVKDALAVIAEKDGRSMANMLEWLIRKHCEREGLGWPPVSSSASGSDTEALGGSMATNVKSKSRNPKNLKLGNKQA